MRKIFLVLVLFLIMYEKEIFSQKQYDYVLVIHGGAGDFDSKTFTTEEYQAYYDILDKVLTIGDSMLMEGSSAVEVVEMAVKLLEDFPLFNAGKGSVFNIKGEIEMDASIMDGKTLKAGAVAAVKTIKNPITAARAVMEKTKHVLLVGEGAELFAQEQNLEIVSPQYFFEEKVYQKYLKMKKEDKGTVGAVALDKEGNLAAATSTGGLMMKKVGRVGDSPIIGAGTYADNSACAVSCTGIGEFFIRTSAAYQVCALMKFANLNITEASQKVIDNIEKLGGKGGLIAVDFNGNIACSFNTKSMYRAYINSKKEKYIKF